MSREMARARRMMSRLDVGPGRPPLPPPGIPPGYIVPLEGRGETFLRSHEGPPDAPVLLLLHGWTASADLQWCTVYETLCERYSVIAIDHRGHGRGIRSEEEFTLEACADDAAAAVRLLVPGRTVIAVGYSMGGPIAMHLWHRHHDLVAGIVLEATALEWKTALEDRLRWRFLVLLDRMLRSRRFHRWIARYLREEVHANPELEPYVPWVLAEMRRSDPNAIVQAGRALREFDARPFAPGMDVPAAMVITTDDHAVRPKKQRALAKAVRAKVFEIHADHDATIAAARPFAALTREAVDFVANAGADAASARRPA
jgi:3-oxoadipate enol-lactonase